MRTFPGVAIMAAWLAFLSSCREQPVGPLPGGPFIQDWGNQGPRTLEQGTLPLQGENTWVYVDSIDGQAHVREVKVVHVALEDGIYRYQMTETEPAGYILAPYDYVYMRNDTVFLVNPNTWTQGTPVILYLPATPIADTVVLQRSTYWVTRVYSLGHNLTTPAGTFDSVYVYDDVFSPAGQHYPSVQYFRPGIGLLELSAGDTAGYSGIAVHSRLIYCTFNHF